MNFKKTNRSCFYWVLSLCLIVSTFCSVSLAARHTPLPNDKAFVLSFSRSSPNEVVAQFNIAPGYYLYRERVEVRVLKDKAAVVHYPPPSLKQDTHRRAFEIYLGEVKIPIKLSLQSAVLALEVEYQGCSEHGFCYPPTHKAFTLNLASLALTEYKQGPNGIKQSESPSFHSLMTNQNQVRDLFSSQTRWLTLLIFAGLGLLLAFTPCVLPMVPILTGIIVGQKEIVSTRKAFLLSLTYVLGSAITYSLAGLAAASMGSSLQAYLQQPWIIGLTAGLFVVLAFSLFGFYDLQMPSSWHNRIASVSRKQRGGTYIGAFILGIISSLIVSPCVTAPLVGVLMYIGETGDKVLGASALFAMGLGMGIPLLMLGLSAGKWLPRRGPWMEAVKKSFGALMLVMAIWLLTRIPVLSLYVVLTGMALVGAAFFISKHANRRFAYASSLVGLTIMVAGVGAPQVLSSWFRSAQMSATAPSFITVSNVAELNKQLALAKAAHKPVILDFYAEWCESCVAMDKNVFSLPEVKQVLNNYVLLRADLTGNSAAEEAVLKQYNIIAPPTVLFFNTDGHEKPSNRIIGEIDKNEFLLRANTFYASICSNKFNC